MLNAKIRKLLPLIVIVLLVIYFVERQKNVPIFAPQITLLAAKLRTADHTEFTLPNLSGKATRLADFKGSVVLLNFFATWCGPCREEMPSIEALFQAYKQKGFVVLGVATDVQGQEVVKPFVQEYGLTFPIVLDTNGSVSKQYRVRGIPATYVLDRQGKIAGMYFGAADWNSKAAHAIIEQLLQEKE